MDNNINEDAQKLNDRWTQLYSRLNSYRSPKTLSFYSSLDASHCSWHYVAYYDITEVTAHCAAQLISPDLDSTSTTSNSDQQTNTNTNKNNNNNSGGGDKKNGSGPDDDEKSYLIIKIPLYVSYLYAGQQGGGGGAWTSVDYKSSVEASIIYKTKSLYGAKSDDKALNINELLSLNGLADSYSNLYDGLNTNVEKNDYLMSLSVSKISMTDQGKLVIEFSTIPAFHGKTN